MQTFFKNFGQLSPTHQERVVSKILFDQNFCPLHSWDR